MIYKESEWNTDVKEMGGNRAGMTKCHVYETNIGVCERHIMT